MYNKEKQTIFNFCLEKLKPLGPYFPVTKLAETGIHPAISTYITAAVDFLVYEDRLLLFKDSKFDYSGEKVQKLLKEIGIELKENKKFAIKFYLDLVKKAIDFNINFLLSPNEEIEKLVYSGKQQATAEEISLKLNYIHYYGYLKNILISFISRKNVVLLNNEEFNKLLGKVDQLSTESNRNDILQQAVSGIGNFFNYGLNGPELVPLDAIKLFLKNKSLFELEEMLEAKTSMEEDKLPQSFFEELLLGNVSKSSVPETERTESIESTTEVTLDNTYSIDVHEESSADNEFTNTEPESKDEPESVTLEIDDVTDSIEFVDEDDDLLLDKPKETDKQDEKVYTLDEKIEMLKNSAEEFSDDDFSDFDFNMSEYSEFLESGDETPKTPRIEVSELLENKKMTRIIEKVFDYDMEEFAEVIENISNSFNQNDALVKVNKTLARNSIDPDSPEARDFKTIIKDYFN